jgi:hypothetical protein
VEGAWTFPRPSKEKKSGIKLNLMGNLLRIKDRSFSEAWNGLSALRRKAATRPFRALYTDF